MQVQAFYYESLDPTWSDWSLHLRYALKKKLRKKQQNDHLTMQIPARCDASPTKFQNENKSLLPINVNLIAAGKRGAV